MRDNFEASLKLVLVHEGGFSNHPADPGGATMKGVTQRVYDGWRKRAGRPVQSVRHISNAELIIIYRELYADKIRFDDLPAGVDYCVFDGAVNSGPAQAVKWLQRAIGGIVVDGVLGPATLAAVQDTPALALISKMCDQRRRFLRALKTYAVFRTGWERRVHEVEAAARVMATGRKAVPPMLDAPGRASIEDAKPRPSKKLGDAATGAGMATGAAAGSLREAQDALTPLTGGGGWIDTTVAVLAIATVVLVAGGLGFRWWQSRRGEEYAAALELPAQVVS